MHLSGFGPGIHAGSSVSQGQVIGYVGSSGLSTGSHLDFRVYKNNVAIDPLKVESPPALPVDKKYRPAFDSLRMQYDKNLQMVK
jgi:murein DD-endopeptidase MepM/ murein hydrolase activator NlpD